MTPADKQGQNGSNGSGDLGASTGTTTGGTGAGLGTTGTGMGSSEPTTPAIGASSSMADPAASGLGINNEQTRSGPDSSESSASTGSSMGQSSFSAGASGGAMGPSGSMSSGSSMGSTGSSGSGIKDQALERANKLRGQATDRARTAAEQGKTRATEAIDGVARAVHDAAGNLENQVPQLGQYAHRAADALDSLSASLRNKSVDELVDDARDFARRSPAIAIGAAVAVGFALSRFLKATSSPSTGSYRAADYSVDDDDDLPAMTTTRTAGSTQPRYNA